MLILASGEDRQQREESSGRCREGRDRYGEVGEQVGVLR